MKVLNTKYQNKQQLHSFIKKNQIVSDNLLVQVFTYFCNRKYINKLLLQLQEFLPQAIIIGATSAGNIIDGKAVTKSTIISFSSFENTSLEAELVEVNKNNYFKAAQQLGKNIIKDNSKALIVFSDGLNAKGERVLAGLEEVNEQIIVAGGKSARFNNQPTYVFTNDQISKQGIVGVSLNNEDLHVYNGYSFGWQQIGKTMTVTKAEGNKVYQIDNENVYDLYERYLGPGIADGLPRTAELEFPLILNRNGELLIRGAADIKDGALVFTGEIKEGEQVRFGYGNPKMILQNSIKNLGALAQEPLEAAYVYSCSSRHELLKNEIELEITPLQRQCLTAGFFTFGEFYHKNKNNYLFNKTTTVLGLSEKQEISTEKIDYDNLSLPDKWHYRTIKALANLAQGVTEELETRNKELKELNEKINKNLNIEETVETIIKLAFQQLNLERGGFILAAEHSINTSLFIGFSEQEEEELKKILTKKQIKNLDFTENFIIQEGQQEFLFSILDYQSALLSPIKVNNSLYGVIFFLHSRKKFFKKQDSLLIEPLLEQAPLAIEKANTFERMEHNLAELSILQKTGSMINSTLNLNEVFNLTIDVIMGTMGVSIVALFLLEDGKLELAAQSELVDDDTLIRLAKRFSWNALQEDEILMRNNISQEFSDRLLNINLSSCLAVPIKIRNEIIGVIVSGQTDFNREFKAEDEKFINILSNQVAIGIENAKMYNEMEELAVQDSLTNLYNHSYFQERLEQKINQVETTSSSLGLLMMDIDNFKQYNDQYGHQVGDRILKILANKLKSLTRESDLVARYGGEEFVIVLSNINQDQLRELGKRINRQISNMNIKYRDLNLQITVSIGGSIYEAGKIKRELIKEADKALYKAKKSGKDQFCLI